MTEGFCADKKGAGHMETTEPAPKDSKSLCVDMGNACTALGTKDVFRFFVFASCRLTAAGEVTRARRCSHNAD